MIHKTIQKEIYKNWKEKKKKREIIIRKRKEKKKKEKTAHEIPFK